MKKIQIILFFILSATFAKAQYAEFKHISIDDGLASSEVYCHLQDSMGYMWFGTSRGVTRYDGYEFKNYTASDGLPSNSIIKMFYDRLGRIWFSTYDGLLGYYKNEEFFIFEHNDTLNKIAKNYYISNLYLDAENNLWITPSLGGIYMFTPDGILIDKTPKITTQSFYFKDFGDGTLFCFLPSQNIEDSIYVQKNKNEYFIHGINRGFRKNFLKISDKEFLISIGSSLYHVINERLKIIRKYNNDITGLFKDKKGDFWISVLYEGVYCYPAQGLHLTPETYLFGMSPISVYQDFQNGYWLSTTENGVFYSPSFQFISYKRFGIPLFNILSLHISNNFLYFSTFDRQVVKCMISKHKIMSIENLLLRADRKYAIQDITSTADSSIWFLGTELIRGKNNKFDIIDTLSRSYRIFGKQNKVYVSYTNGLKIFQNNDYESVFIDNFPTSNAIFVDENFITWIGTINGLYRFENKSYSYLGEKLPQLKYRINDIVKFDKYLVLATNGNGLIFYNHINNTVRLVDEKNGLNSNFVNCLYSDKNDVWAGTNKGLSKVNIVEHYDSLQIFITQFTEIDGLYAKEIKDIDKTGDCIYLGTSQGLISFYPHQLTKNLIPPILNLDSIVVNKKTLDVDTFYKFNWNENTLSFYFKGISFNAGEKVKYKYQLLGYENKWVSTANRFVRFPNLPSGEYSLLVTASADGIIWNEVPIKIDFKIKRKFTRTIFFYILIFFILIILAAGILSYRYSTLEKDLILKRKMMRAEQKALRSQMNPHFIFNALNSIRRYILENDSDKADFYLTSFATLMRRVLDNSKHEFISLEDEITTLKLYLELEKMRFDESFSFVLEIDETISLSTVFLPTMIIQPIIENAIWHGIAPLKLKGLLTLSLKKIKDKSFVCIVDDNGIGRKKAEEIAQRRVGHQSTGIKNLQERINILNSVGTVSINYNVFDKYDPSGVSTGTRVEIEFNYIQKDKTHRISIKLFGKKYYFSKR